MHNEDTTGAGEELKIDSPAVPADAVAEGMGEVAARLAAFVSAEVGEGRGQALRAAIRTIETMEALGAKPDPGAPAVAGLAEMLLDMLRTRNAVDPEEAGKGHSEAAGMMLASAAFLMERHGSVHMAAFMVNMAQVLQDIAARGDHPLSKPPAGVPMLPPPPDVPVVVHPPRSGQSIPARINVMGDFLSGLAQAEAQADALASIAAAANFLRERFGEAYAVGVLQQAEVSISRAAALSRWQPPKGSRPN